MKYLLKRQELIGFIVIFLGLIFIYRDFIFNGKVLFPSNFLAQFYSPWSTEKFKGWESGIPHKPIGGNDQIRFFYPKRIITNRQINKGIIPLWDPYIFSGNVHMADFQTAVFYPLNVLYLFISQITAWSILVFIQPIMATFFTYLFLRQLSLSKISSLFGAIAFSLCGFMTTWSQENAVVSQTSLWLPLILFGIESYMKSNNKWLIPLIIFALASCFLAGFFQEAFYIYILSAIYFLFRLKSQKKEKRKTTFSIVTGVFIFSFLLCAIQLLPSMDAFRESSRTTSSIDYLFSLYLLPITHIFNLFVPDIFGNPGAYNFFGRGFYQETVMYIGLIPVFFSFLAIVGRNLSLKKSFVVFFSLSSLISFFLTLDSPITRLFYSLHIPLVSTFQPSRILMITSFSFSVLAGFGLELWINSYENKIKKNIRLISMFFLIILLTIMSIALLWHFSNSGLSHSLQTYMIRENQIIQKNYSLIMIKNTILSVIFFVALYVLLRFKKIKKTSIWAVFALAFLGQLYFFQKYVVIGNREFLYPPLPILSFVKDQNSQYRFLSFGEPVLSDIPEINNLYSPEGVDPIFPGRYGELLYTIKNQGKMTKNIPRIETELSYLPQDESIEKDKRRLTLMSLLGVKYIAYYEKSNSLPIEKKFPSKDFKLLYKTSNWHIFEYKNVFPRAFLTNNFVVKNSDQDIVNQLFDSSYNPRHSVILEENPDQLQPGHSNDTLSSTEIVQYEPQKIQINTESKNDNFLFLSDNYYPGWKAFIDSKPTKIYRADYTFRSVFVPKGKHTIRMIYDPFSFQIGKQISEISLVIFLGFILYLLIKPRIKNLL